MKYTFEDNGESYECDLLSPFDALNCVYGFLMQVRELPEDEARPELLKSYELANIALGNKELTHDQEALLSLFFAMGFKMGKEVTTYPQLEVIRAAALNALNDKEVRERPLEEINLKKKTLKEMAQKMAGDLWCDDIAQNIRLAAMCEKVYRMLVDRMMASDTQEEEELFEDLFALMPGQPEGLKPWLRPVAPAYAQKRGRPKGGK